MFFFFEFTWQDFLDELPEAEHPANESDILINLQKKWLTDGDRKAQTLMWTKSITIAKKFIIKERKQKGFFLDPEDFEEKALEAVEYVFSRYNRRIDNWCWCVRKNFISAIYNGVRHALYYQSKSEQLYESIKKNKGGLNVKDLYFREDYRPEYE